MSKRKQPTKKHEPIDSDPKTLTLRYPDGTYGTAIVRRITSPPRLVTIKVIRGRS